MVEKRSFNDNILGKHKQDLVKTPERHHNLSQNREMVVFWNFQLNSSVQKREKREEKKYKKEDHSIISVGASLIWNNFWANFFCRLKDTIHLYILAENKKNDLSRFRENSKYIMFDYFPWFYENWDIFETFCLSHF